MSSSNPTITASTLITDIEARLRSPNISTTVYIPWISYSYQKLFNAISSVGQQVREELFGDSDTIDLSTGTLEHNITDSIPRFGGFIKVEVKYGASGDLRNPATRLRSVSQWRNLANVSTSYQPKDKPLYYKSGNSIGIIPVPPESGAVAYVRFVKRPYQITEGTDEIDIPYRFLYPMLDYIQSKAVQKLNEDYSTSVVLERNFNVQLEEIKEFVASEFNENDGTNAVEISGNSLIFDNPLR